MDRDELVLKALNSKELPTLPIVASQLISLTSKEETTLADIAQLVSQDVALSAKILKVSNSAFYSFPQQISSIKQAVSILGTNAVRSLVLSFSFLSMKEGKGKTRFDFEKFWEKALASAVAAKLILEKVKGADTEEIFVTGLLQNLGELVLARTFPAEYDTVLQVIDKEKLPGVEVEETALGGSHAFIGAEVAKKWGFPEVLVLPIQYHHEPDKYTSKNKKLQSTVKAVYLSDLVVNILYSEEPNKYHSRFRKEAKKLLGLNNKDIESVLETMHSEVQAAGTSFNLKIRGSKSIQDILQEANIRLSLLNLDYDQINKQLIQAKIHLEEMTRELEEKNQILNNLANIDGLTEIYNHRFFQNALDQEISRATRHESFLSLLLIDIDRFKLFNDTYGHQVGDFVLVEFAKILRNDIRKYDILARYGGEEFAIILPKTSTEDALVVGEKLRKTVETATFTGKTENYHVTASFGQAYCSPATEDDFDKNSFISKADEALYEAKEKGRNLVVSYVPKKKWFPF